jgi:hypothetical protein
MGISLDFCLFKSSTSGNHGSEKQMYVDSCNVLLSHIGQPL